MLSGVKMTQRLIDADALKTALYYDVSKGTYGEFTDGSEVSLTDREILKLIDQQPTIDAEPVKHGKWIFQRNYTWACSECGTNPTEGMGYVQCKEELFEYCPNCGADMIGESE